jgi:hypothetical protein
MPLHIILSTFLQFYVLIVSIHNNLAAASITTIVRTSRHL